MGGYGLVVLVVLVLMAVAVAACPGGLVAALIVVQVVVVVWLVLGVMALAVMVALQDGCDNAEVIIVGQVGRHEPSLVPVADYFLYGTVRGVQQGLHVSMACVSVPSMTRAMPPPSPLAPSPSFHNSNNLIVAQLTPQQPCCALTLNPVTQVPAGVTAAAARSGTAVEGVFAAADVVDVAAIHADIDVAQATLIEQLQTEFTMGTVLSGAVVAASQAVDSAQDQVGGAVMSCALWWERGGGGVISGEKGSGVRLGGLWGQRMERCGECHVCEGSAVPFVLLLLLLLRCHTATYEGQAAV